MAMVERELSLRITLIDPPPGVTFRLRRGRADLVAPTHQSDERMSFDFTVRIAEGRPNLPPNLRSPFTQGPPASRFVYINSGTAAGQFDSCWTRAAKVPLSGITWELIERALSAPGVVLEAQIKGTGKDGGPACATVPLLGGWSIVPRL